jgi:hypothetical protein
VTAKSSNGHRCVNGKDPCSRERDRCLLMPVTPAVRTYWTSQQHTSFTFHRTSLPPVFKHIPCSDSFGGQLAPLFVLRELADSGSECHQNCISPVSVHANETGSCEATNWVSSHLFMQRIKRPMVPNPSDTLLISTYCRVDITFILICT